MKYGVSGINNGEIYTTGNPLVERYFMKHLKSAYHDETILCAYHEKKKCSASCASCDITKQVITCSRGNFVIGKHC